jgi:hypothetical protein
MKKKKIIRIVLVSLLVIVAFCGIYIYKEYNRKLPKTENLSAHYDITATQLIKEFEENEVLANKKYLDKVLSLKGTIQNKETSGNGFVVSIKDDAAASSSVRCSIDSAYAPDIAGITDGTKITIKGICTGFNKDELLGSDVIMVRCLVESNK